MHSNGLCCTAMTGFKGEKRVVGRDSSQDPSANHVLSPASHHRRPHLKTMETEVIFPSFFYKSITAKGVPEVIFSAKVMTYSLL